MSVSTSLARVAYSLAPAMQTYHDKPSHKDLPALALGLLREVMEHFPADPKQRPQEFIIHVHAKKLIQLAEDIIFLESHGRSGSMPIVARSMLESLFRLAVATKNPAEATLGTLLEFEWELIQSEIPAANPRRLEQIRKDPKYVAIGCQMKALSEKWGLPQKAFFGATRKFSTHQWAVKAGMRHLYDSRYVKLSTYSHTVGPSFIFPNRKSYVLAVVCLSLLEATRKILAYPGLDLPGTFRASANSLWQVFVSYQRDKSYLKLFVAEIVEVIPGARLHND